MGRNTPLKMACISLIVVMTFLFGSTSAVSFMSIDLGNENMKIAVVAPGMPMEIALNKESKRKTPTAIAFRGGERTLGAEAITAGMKSPTSLLTHFIDLLGKNVSHPIVQDYTKRFSHVSLSDGPNGGLVIDLDGLTFTIEELVAQILMHAREIASEHSQQPIRDAVITVPAFFNQVERRALLESANMANIKVLSLISTPAAVGLNYAMFRRKEIVNMTGAPNGADPQYVLFYDMGAKGSTASLVEYSAYTTKERGYTEVLPQLKVVGVGYDRTLGGQAFQLTLTSLLIDAFYSLGKLKNGALLTPRALGKLRKEAQKVKTVLSANQEYLAQVENVMEDIDLRHPVSRKALEDMIQPILESALWGPVAEALAAGGIEQSAVSGLVLVGGATRVPLIQSMLKKNWGRDLLKNINADEAAAMGAIYRAADLGEGYKVKAFRVLDAHLFPIQVDFEKAVENSEGQIIDRIVSRNLYAKGNVIPQKKVMTFNKHTDDFEFRIKYGSLSEIMPQNHIKTQFGTCYDISKVEISGVTESFEKNVKSKGGSFKGIKVHFVVDDSGMLKVKEAEMLVEHNTTAPPASAPPAEGGNAFEKIGETLNALFGGDNSTAEGAATEGVKNETLEGGSKNKNVSTKLETVKTSLKVKEVYLDLAAKTEEDVQKSVKKLADIDAAEQKRRQTEASRNNLESKILEIRDKLDQEEYQKCTTNQVAENLRTNCAQMEEWLYDDGFNAEGETYDAKIKELTDVFNPIENRVQEVRNRPQALQELADVINRTSTFIAKLKSDQTDLLSAADVQKLEDMIIDYQKWQEESEEAQEKLPTHEDPVIRVSDVATRLHDMEREVKYMIGKMKIASEARAREAAKKAEEEKKKKAEEEKKKKKAEAEAKKNETIKPEITPESQTNEDLAGSKKEEDAPVKPDGVKEEEETTHTEL